MPLAANALRFGLTWTLTGLAVVLTGVRYWIRSNILKSFHWDDAAHLLGLLCLVAQVSVNTASDLVAMNASSFIDTDPSRYERVVTASIQLNFAGNVLTWCCLYAVKAAFLLLYLHIFKSSQSFVRAWWAITIIVMATFCVLFAGSLIQCGDPRESGQEMKCICEHYSSHSGRVNIFEYGTALNVGTDLLIIALPLAMLKRLQIRAQAKLGLAVVFCLAFITIVLDILRACEFITFGALTGGCVLWMNLESAAAVLVSCLPSFGAFLNKKQRRTRYQGRSGRPIFISRPLAIAISVEKYVNPSKTDETVTESTTTAVEDYRPSASESPVSNIVGEKVYVRC